MTFKTTLRAIADAFNRARAPKVQTIVADLERKLDALKAAEEACHDKALAEERKAAQAVERAISLRQESARARRVSARLNELLD